MIAVHPPPPSSTTGQVRRLQAPSPVRRGGGGARAPPHLTRTSFSTPCRLPSQVGAGALPSAAAMLSVAKTEAVVVAIAVVSVEKNGARSTSDSSNSLAVVSVVAGATAKTAVVAEVGLSSVGVII